MQVRIEIDVKPEELRRFLGLPDVGGLQDDIVAFLREKVGVATEFEPTAFIKGNLEGLLNNPTLRRLLEGTRAHGDGSTPSDGSARPKPGKAGADAPRNRKTSSSGSPRTGAHRKPADDGDEN